ncbi:MAG: hypothetical protein J0M08_05350 [Bacteroidetes bacterium]|nr:hypothetical protein [Bacteroidota bacterium]
MVETELFKKQYNELLELVANEAKLNKSALEYLNYLNKYYSMFVAYSNKSDKENLKEFLRSANRYLDEFSFSADNSYLIKNRISDLYDILDKENNAM